jgi:sugar/nucleoside kinase (ribokinase family)
MGPEYVVKKGEHGALCFTTKKCFAGIAIRRGFDPTGAGDTFAGGFAGFITSENVSSEKCHYLWFKFSLLVWRNLGLKEWLL